MQVHTTIEDRIAHVRLDRPPANAMNAAFIDEITACFKELEDNAQVGASVISGTGRIFSAGVDLKHLPGLDVAGQDQLVLAINAMCAAIFGSRKPVIGALNGHAIAGGMVLALCCDYRIAADRDALFGLTEVRVGVAFPEATFHVMDNQLSPQALRRLTQFGQNIDSDAALAMGVVDELAEPQAVIERAMAKARACLAIPAGGYAQVKHQLRGSAMQKIQVLVERKQDKFLGGWLSEEARTAAMHVLHG